VWIKAAVQGKITCDSRRTVFVRRRSSLEARRKTQKEPQALRARELEEATVARREPKDHECQA